jgi:hypothetical protein
MFDCLDIGLQRDEQQTAMPSDLRVSSPLLPQFVLADENNFHQPFPQLPIGVLVQYLGV